MADSLKEKTVTGVIWSAFQKFGSVFLNFISSIILARLLTPEDYGCIGMLAIFMALSSTFIDGGFGSALIQKKRPTNEDYSTIFYWNILLSLVLYIILFLSAPIIADFYNITILCPVLRVQGIVLIINAIRIVQLNQLKKQLLFKKIALVDTCISGFSLVLTIIMAWKGMGVWALVAQQISLSFFTTVIYWLTSSWRPLKVFSIKSFKELFSFGSYILLSNMINTFCNNIQGLLIGKFYSPSTLGYYSKANSTEQLASTFVSNMMDQVAYPVFAEGQNDTNFMSRMLKKFTNVLGFFTYPLMFLLILMAKPIFVILYSDKWIESVPYFQILCIAGIAISMQGLTYYVVVAAGHSKDMFKWTFIKRGLGLIFVIIGIISAGMIGLLIGFVMSAWTLYLINAYLVQKHIGYTLINQLKDISPIMYITTCVTFIVFLLTSLFSLNMYLTGVIQFILFITLYLLMVTVLKLQAFEDFKETLHILKSKFRTVRK